MDHICISLSVALLWIVWMVVICGGISTDAQFVPPRIVEQPHIKNQQSGLVPLGSSTTLSCRATGTPAPKYLWLKDGTSLANEALDNPDWNISLVTSRTPGIYQCIAENPCGSTISSAFHLFVPYLAQQFTSAVGSVRRVERGDAVILLAPAIESFPDASFSWIADGVPISVAGSSRKYVQTLNNDLVILDADVGDFKEYKLRASNQQLGETRTSPAYHVLVNDTPVPASRVPPRLIIPPTNVTVKQGDSQAIFQCIVNARPLPELRLSWRGKDGKLLGADGTTYFISPDGRRLTIVSPGQQHEGSYECTGELPGEGTVTASAQLVITAAPTIVQSPSLEMSVDVGQSVMIPCVTEGKPAPSVTWYRNAKPISAVVGNNHNKFSVLSNGSLVVPKIGQEDGGIYQCMAQNSAGQDMANTWLRITRSVQHIGNAPSQVTVRENDPVLLGCPGQTASAPTDTTWYFKGVPLNNAGSVYQTDESGNLLISSVTKASAGMYYCASKTFGGSTNQSVTLEVNERTRISNPPRDTRLILGSKVTLSCGTTKDPSVSEVISWYKDGAVLDPSSLGSRRQIYANGTLEITGTRNSDVGIYKCRVVSAAGNDTQSARLDVIELPFAPHIRAELINGTKNVNVSWLPNFDGNSPIIRFILQYTQFTNDSDLAGSVVEGDWQTLLSNFSATDRFYIVRDLKPSASYQFRVKAVNNVGEGSPSAASAPILLPQTPPSAAPRFSASARNSTAIMMQWQPPAESDWNGILGGYIIRYKLAGYSDLAWTEVSVSQESRRNYILDDLIAWKLYENQMAAFNNKGTGVWSESFRVKTLEGVPEAAPSDVTASALSSTSITTGWRPPDPQQINGVNQGYRVELWQNPANFTQKPVKVLEVPPSPFDPLERLSASFEGLGKYATHDVTALCFTGAGNGPRSAPVTVTTLEDLPGIVNDLHIFNIRDSSLEVSWNKPEAPNGVITGYVLECGESDSATNLTSNPRTFRLDRTGRNFTVDELRPQTGYVVKVSAETKVGLGEARVTRIRSSVPPTLPCAPANVGVDKVEARNVVVKYDPVCDGNTTILQVNLDIQSRDMKSEEWKRFYEQKSDISTTVVQLLSLDPATEYRVRLSLDNVVGHSPVSLPSDWFETLPDSPSNPPGNLTLRAINATAIRARWTPLVTDQWNGKTGSYWLVFRSLNDTLTGGARERTLVVNDSSSGSVVLDNLEEFVTYEARISAVNGIGSSEKSVVVVETTRESVPDRSPESVVAHGIGSSSIVVQWGNISALHQNGILQGYRIFYSTGSSELTFDIEDPGTHYANLINLEKYTDYSIRVAGYTRIGTGVKSRPAIERSLEDVPDRPYNVMFPEVSSDQVRVTWEPPLRPNGIILGFRVSYKMEEFFDDIGAVFLPLQTRSFTAVNLLPKKNYVFTVAANTSIGWGMPAEVTVRTVLDRERPEKPENPSISVSMVKARSLSVSWQPGRKDDNAPIRAFLIQYSEGNRSVWKPVSERLDGRTTSYNVEGLIPNTFYKFRLQAMNDVGSSDWSGDSDPAATAEAAPDIAPDDFSAVPYTTSSLSLTWRPLSAGINGRLAGYLLQFHRIPPGVFASSVPYQEISLKPNVTSYNLTELTRDATYELRIAAFTRAGTGPFSPLLAVFVGVAVPQFRVGEVVAAPSGPSSITVSWILPVADPKDITGFKISYVDAAFNNMAVDFVEASLFRHTIRNLIPFSTYCISVYAFSNAGDGPKTQLVNVTTMEALPGPPENLLISGIQLTQVTLTWSAPIRPNGLLRGYEIMFTPPVSPSAVKNEGRRKVGPLEDFAVISGLEENTSYSFSLRAETSSGLGNATVGNVTTGPQPGSPAQLRQLSVELAEATVKFRWVNSEAGAAPVTGYLVQGKRDGTSVWDTVDTVESGLLDSYQMSYNKVVPSARYTFRMLAMNRLGVSPPSDYVSPVMIPNWNSMVATAPKQPFYLEIWFLILVAAAGSIAVILLIACLVIKSKAAKYRQEVEKVTSTADILQFPDDDEFAAPTALELRQSMRRSARKPSSNTNLYSTSAGASMRRKNLLASQNRLPPFVIGAPPTGMVPNVAYSDIGDASDIYPPRVNRAFVNNDESATVTSRASSSLTEKPSSVQESSTDEVDDESSGAASRMNGELPDEQSSSFVNHYANLNNALRRPWADGAGTSESSRRARRTGLLPVQPPYRRSTATSISASIADSDSTAASLNGHLLINNKPGSRNPLPGFSSFV